MLGSGAQVRRVFCPVAIEMTNRLAQIEDVISLMTSAAPSGVHAIVFSRSGARVSATFRSPPPSGEATKIPSRPRANAIWRSPVGIALLILIVVPAVRTRAAKNVQGNCTAGKPYCYDAPVHLGAPINTPWFEGKPSLSANGLELYFVSDRPGALGGSGDQDIYVSRRASVNASWGAPERVPPPVSSPFFDITPSISLDGLDLYFGSNRPGPNSPPWPDLWVSHRASVTDPWDEAINLGAGVNTPLFEGSIDVSPDRRTAYFAAVSAGFVFDIFVSTRRSADEPFGPRVKLPQPVNSDGQDYGPALT